MSIINTSSMVRKVIIDNQPKEMFARDLSANLFEERALLLAAEDDIVILRKALPAEYIDFIKSGSQFQVIFLNATNDAYNLSDTLLNEQNLHIIKNALQEKYSNKRTVVQAYIPDKSMELLANKLGLCVCGGEFYSENHRKSATQHVCAELGLNLIPSVYVNEATDLRRKRIIDFINSYNKIVIKPDIGLGGKLVSVLDPIDIYTPLTPAIFPAVIQEYLPPQIEGSIQFVNISGNWETYICETFQSNLKFFGFKYPCPLVNKEEILSSAHMFLTYFIEKYGEDIPSFGVDFLVSNNKIYYHDINPRSTGVTYIFSLLHRLYGKRVISNLEFIYLQHKFDYQGSYLEVRNMLDTCGLTHISKEKSEGYALLYPGMLEGNLLNILLVSGENKVNDYYKQIYQLIVQS